MLEHVLHSYVNTAHYVPIKCNIKLLVLYCFHKIIVKKFLVHLEAMQSDSEAEEEAEEDAQSCLSDVILLKMMVKERINSNNMH